MGKRFCFVLLFFFISISAVRPQWVKCNGPEGVYTNDLFVSGNNLYIAAGSGAFKSVDGGSNWTYIGNGLPTNRGANCIALIDNTLMAGYSVVGIFSSTNGGTSWSESNNSLSNKNVTTLYVNGSNVFAGTASGAYYSTDKGANWSLRSGGVIATKAVAKFASIGSTLFAATNDGIYSSTNNGETWTDISAGLDDRLIRTLAVDGTKIYAATGNSLYYSADNGITWTKINSVNNQILALAVSGDNIFYTVVGSGLFRSTNAGGSFSQIQNLTGSSTNKGLKVSGSTIFCSTTSCMNISTDNGNTWSAKISGLNNSYVKTIFSHNNKIYTGSYYYVGINSANNEGTVWNSLVPYYDIYCFASSGTDVLAGGFGLYRSTDGTTFSYLENSINTKNIYSLFISGSNYYAGTNSGIYISHDDGATWAASNTGLTNTTIYAVEWDGAKLYAGTAGAGVFSSTDFGATWTPTALTGKNVIKLKFINNKLYAGCWGTGMFVSSDAGASWTEINTGITNKNIYSISSDNNNNLYIGGGNKVFFSSNEGGNWIDKTGNLPEIDIWSVLVSGNYVFIGTGGMGVWKRTLAEIVDINNEFQLPSGFNLEQNYPNPFNPSTGIKFSIPKSCHVLLKVYDMLGREVMILADEYKSAGTYNIRFDAAGLASGTYIYRLQADEFIESRKMSFIK